MSDKSTEALKLAIHVLQQIIDPKKFGSSPSIVWAQAVEAETKCRAALSEGGKQ